MDLQQRAPDEVQSDLTIRGSTFGQTLVLLNGLRMNDAQSGHHNMDLPVPTMRLSASKFCAARARLCMAPMPWPDPST